MNTAKKKYDTEEAKEAWSRVAEDSVDYGRAVKKIIKSKAGKSVPAKAKKVR